MRNILTGIGFCLITSIALAQQDPLYSQYINNPFVLNPAYAGMTNNLNTAVGYRQQWAGLEGNPTTINANGHISLLNNTMGAGLMVVSDNIGTSSVNEVYGSYAYRIKLTGDKVLSFGLQGGFINTKTDNSALTQRDPDDPLFTGQTSTLSPGFGAGVILTDHKFFVGLSVPRLLEVTTNMGEFEPVLYTRHFYAMGSYVVFINERMRFKPSVLLKAVSGSPVSLDLNAALIFYENYTAGILVRDFSTYGVFLQALLGNSFRLGYTFEVPTNKSVGTSFSTHELMLGVRFDVLRFHSNSGVTSF